MLVRTSPELAPESLGILEYIAQSSYPATCSNPPLWESFLMHIHVLAPVD